MSERGGTAGVDTTGASRWRGVAASGLAALLVLLAGCNTIAPYSNAAFNAEFKGDDPGAPPPPGTRHTFQVDGRLGNPKVLMFLALSGGGSRAAYLSTATMLALRQRLGVDLLAEVDVISSVSGGSLAAAYYTASRDEEIADPALAARVRALPPSEAALAKLKVLPGDRLRCSAGLTDDELRGLRAAWGPDSRDVATIEQLCLADRYPLWLERDVRDTMKTNFLTRWIANWFWPTNIAKYWLSSFDRSDIMAQTLADSIYSRRGIAGLGGGAMTLAELNPLRPYLLINATNASSQMHKNGEFDEFPFGSVFTFTHEDFIDRLHADAGAYALARAVMGSSAFPLVFPSMTLQDFRPVTVPRCTLLEGPDCRQERYLHIFDGGNSDNLGLRSIKRTLLQLEAQTLLKDYDRVIVVLIDAFTTPRGADRDKPDPRSLISLLVDTNVSDAVDSLLLANRDRLLGEFDDGVLVYSRDCGNVLRQLPRKLCDQLAGRDSQRLKIVPGGRPAEGPLQVLDLSDKLVFYHFGFEDVEESFAAGLVAGGSLRHQLDTIPTSFMLSEAHARLIDEAVEAVIQPRNPCLLALAALVQAPSPLPPGQIGAARSACQRAEATRINQRQMRP